MLQSVSGNQERAIDALLGMSDPDYRSEAPAAEAVAPQPPVTLVCYLLSWYLQSNAFFVLRHRKNSTNNSLVNWSSPNSNSKQNNGCKPKQVDVYGPQCINQLVRTRSRDGILKRLRSKKGRANFKINSTRSQRVSCSVRARLRLLYVKLTNTPLLLDF